MVGFQRGRGMSRDQDARNMAPNPPASKSPGQRVRLSPCTERIQHVFTDAHRLLWRRRGCLLTQIAIGHNVFFIYNSLSIQYWCTAKQYILHEC